MWFAFSLAISVFDITVIIINCSFLSCVISIKRGSTPGIFILEGLHWIGGDIYICYYFFPLAVSADLSAFPDLAFSKVEAYTQKNLAAGTQPKAISFLLSLDIYTMWKVSCHIVRKSVVNTHTRSSLKVVVVVVFFIHIKNLRLVFFLFTVSYEQGFANITAKCHRSMRKSDLPHQPT